jgi:hypothetical protein
MGEILVEHTMIEGCGFEEKKPGRLFDANVIPAYPFTTASNPASR